MEVVSETGAVAPSKTVRTDMTMFIVICTFGGVVGWNK